MDEFASAVGLPALRSDQVDLSSHSDFPVLIQTGWPALHSVFRPDGKVGSCIYQRQVRDKYEIVVRNWLGAAETHERGFEYLDYADQELKLEVLGSKTSAWKVPYKIRLNSRSEAVSQSINWDVDHPKEHLRSWCIGHREYEVFSDDIDVSKMFSRLEQFAANAVSLMRQGQMPDFSDLNEITGMDFVSPPDNLTQEHSHPLLTS